MLGESGSRLEALRCGVKKTTLVFQLRNWYCYIQLGVVLILWEEEKEKTNFVSSSPKDYYPITQRADWSGFTFRPYHKVNGGNELLRSAVWYSGNNRVIWNAIGK